MSGTVVSHALRLNIWMLLVSTSSTLLFRGICDGPTAHLLLCWRWLCRMPCIAATGWCIRSDQIQQAGSTGDAFDIQYKSFASAHQKNPHTALHKTVPGICSRCAEGASQPAAQGQPCIHQTQQLLVVHAKHCECRT